MEPKDSIKKPNQIYLLLYYFLLLVAPAVYPIIVDGFLGIVLEAVYGGLLTFVSIKLEAAPKQWGYIVFVIIIPLVAIIAFFNTLYAFRPAKLLVAASLIGSMIFLIINLKSRITMTWFIVGMVPMVLIAFVFAIGFSAANTYKTNTVSGQHTITVLYNDDDSGGGTESYEHNVINFEPVIRIAILEGKHSDKYGEGLRHFKDEDCRLYKPLIGFFQTLVSDN